MNNNEINSFESKNIVPKTTKELLDIIRINGDAIIDIFRDYYNESLNENNVYTKLFASVNGDKTFDFNSLNECCEVIKNNELTDFRIYVCSCAKTISGFNAFAAIDLTIIKAGRIMIYYMNEFDGAILQKYREKLKNLLGENCRFICHMRNDKHIIENDSDDYETAVNNYRNAIEKENKEFIESGELNKMMDDVNKKVDNLSGEQNGKIRTSIQFQLSNALMFNYVFNNWYMLNQFLTLGPEAMKGFLLVEWNNVKNDLIEQNKFIINDSNKNVTRDDFNMEIYRTKVGTVVYLITFPDYEYTDGASKYIAIATTFRIPRFFTLAYLYNPSLNKPFWDIVEMYYENSKVAFRSYGSIDNMQESSFVDRIMKVLDEYEMLERNNAKISKNEAIEIANNDRNLKDSIFKKWKEKDGIILGFIAFNDFDANMVKLKDRLAWHIKVKNGRWGGSQMKDGEVHHLDGIFSDKISDISCYVTCDNGEYYFADTINSDDVHPVD